MSKAIDEPMKRVHQLTEEQAERAVRAIDRIIEEGNKNDDNVSECPHCSGTTLVRNGRKSGRQRFKCKECGATFVYTAGTTLQGSRYGEAVWKQVIRDTLEGAPLDETAWKLGFSRATACNVRHKLFCALEAYEEQNPTVLNGVCEADDTYVLESYKGTKLAYDFWRKPCKHGAVAQSRGVSSEYVGIQTAVMRGWKICTKAANRATPSAGSVEEVFSGHIGTDALVLCDGAKNYGVLSKTCEVKTVDNGMSGEFSHINNVNGYHSFIKELYNRYRGVTTKYLRIR